MKKILFQKFIKDTLKLFITIAFVIGLIVWVIQAVNYLDFVTEGLKINLKRSKTDQYGEGSVKGLP